MKSLFRNVVLMSLIVAPNLCWSLDASSTAQSAIPATFDNYAGLGIDAINFSTNRNGIISAYSLTQSASIQSNSTNFHFFFGHRLDQFLAIQFDFIGLGSVRTTDLGITKSLFEPTLLSLSAVMHKPFSENLIAFGKLGGTSWSFGSSDATQNRGFGLSFGAGLDFNLYGGTDRMLRLEWNHYKMDDVLVSSADSLTLGAVFNF